MPLERRVPGLIGQHQSLQHSAGASDSTQKSRPKRRGFLRGIRSSGSPPRAWGQSARRYPTFGIAFPRVLRNDNSLGRCMPTTGIALFLLTGKGCGLYSVARIWSRTSTRNHFDLVEHIDRLDLVDRDGRTTIR